MYIYMIHRLFGINRTTKTREDYFPHLGTEATRTGCSNDLWLIICGDPIDVIHTYLYDIIYILYMYVCMLIIYIYILYMYVCIYCVCVHIQYVIISCTYHIYIHTCVYIIVYNLNLEHICWWYVVLWDSQVQGQGLPHMYTLIAHGLTQQIL